MPILISPGLRALGVVLLLILSVWDSPVADAQIGRLINRAREAASSAADRAQAAASSDALPSSPAGTPAPAIDFVTLLDTKFYGDRGVFEFHDALLVFAPPGLIDRDEIRGHYLVRDASGSPAVRLRLGGVGGTASPAIVGLMTRSGDVQNIENPVEAGRSYTMDVELAGSLVGSLPFTVEQTSSGDAFNPVTTLRLEGPWRTHAFFSHETDRPGYTLHFNAWLSHDEVEPGATTEVSVRRNGQEVAFGAASANVRLDWFRTQYPMFKAESRHPTRFGVSGRNAEPWTIEDVTPGTYEVVLQTEDGPFRTMTIEGANGAFVDHPRSALEYMPRTRFLTSRWMSGRRYQKTNSVYWIAPAE